MSVSPSTTLVDQLRLVLKDHNSDQLAAKTGIHPVSIRRFRSSGKGLSLDKLQKLADALDLQIIVARQVTSK